MSAAEYLVTTMAQLEALYGPKNPNSVAKEIDHISNGYRRLIESAPFVAIATCGPEGLDCSPKGDPAGFVHILDDKTIAIPDRAGQQPARRLSQYHSRSAHRGAVSHSGRRRDVAHQWPRRDFD